MSKSRAVKLASSCVVACGILFFGTAPRAATVTYSYAGVWDTVSTQSGSSFSILSVGDVFAGTLTYDDTAPPLSAPAGQFKYSGGHTTVTTGGQTFTTSPGNNTIFGNYDDISDIWYDQSFGGVGYGVGTAYVDVSPIYYIIETLWLVADQNSDIHPEFSPLTSSYFELLAGILDGTTGNLADSVYHTGHLTTFELQPVPIPAAPPLLAAGLGAMGFMGWRNKRKATC